MRNVLQLTEQGEGKVTPDFLLGIIADFLVLATTKHPECPVSIYIAGTLNTLGKLGLVEVIQRDGPSPPKVNTPAPDEPPPFMMEHFKSRGEDGVQ